MAGTARKVGSKDSCFFALSFPRLSCVYARAFFPLSHVDTIGKKERRDKESRSFSVSPSVGEGDGE